MSGDYWKRTGYVVIQDRNGNSVRFGGAHDSLDFKFSGEKIGDFCGRFSVSILGLTPENISRLTVWDPRTAMKSRRRIQVFAGYEKDSLDSPILDGVIINAIPTSPPEMWLNFDCMNYAGEDGPIDVCYTVSGDLETMARVMAQTLNLGFLWKAKHVSPKATGTFVMKGTLSSSLRRFSEQFGVSIVNQNGIVTVYDKDGWLDDVSNPVPVSTATGMIDISRIDAKGAIIRRRLNSNTPLFSWIDLRSTLIPSANGHYYVMKEKYEGHFRGDEWYTEIETIRKGAS